MLSQGTMQIFINLLDNTKPIDCMDTKFLRRFLLDNLLEIPIYFRIADVSSHDLKTNKPKG